MEVPVSLMELVVFHTLDRRLYNRLVTKIDVDPILAHGVIALWLWLESIGHHDLVFKIISLHDQALRTVVAEGQACIATIRPNTPQPTAENDIPLTSSMLNNPINLNFIHYNHNLALHGIRHFLHKVCYKVFNQNVVNLFEEKKPTHTCKYTCSMVAPSNPARYTPIWPNLDQPLNEEHRSMFLTFSRGYPIPPEEIVDFFTSNWGDCIESVMIEETLLGCDPQFGRIVLKDAQLIPIILNGNPTAHFAFNGKQIRVRRFIPKKI